MCVYDYDTYEVSHAQVRTARKTWTCQECGRLIASGERYEHHSGLYDGRWDRNITCAHCVEGRRFLDVVCGGGWLYADVWDETDRHVDELDDLNPAPSWTSSLIDELGIEYAELEGDRRAQVAGALTHEGATVARLVRCARRRWDGLAPDDVRELAATAIEAWQTVEDAAA